MPFKPLGYRCILWRRAWQSTPVFSPGEFHRQRSLAGYSPCGHKKSDTTEQLTHIDALAWNAMLLYIWPHLLNISHLFIYLFTHSLTHTLANSLVYLFYKHNRYTEKCTDLMWVPQRTFAKGTCLCNSAQNRISNSSPKLPVSPPCHHLLIGDHYYGLHHYGLDECCLFLVSMEMESCVCAGVFV